MDTPLTDIPKNKIVHWVWDDLPNESLCGLDLSHDTWMPDSTSVNCEKCIEIDNLCREFDFIGASVA